MKSVLKWTGGFVSGILAMTAFVEGVLIYIYVQVNKDLREKNEKLKPKSGSTGRYPWKETSEEKTTE